MRPDELDRPVVAVRPGAGALFPSTSWTLLEQARGHDDGARDALAQLTERYYRPVYAYLCAIVRDVERAEELTHGFFEKKFLSGRLLELAQHDKGRFRHYLKQALRNYVRDIWRQKSRQPSELEVRPDKESQDWDRLVQEQSPNPEAVFHATWVRALLAEALEQVRRMCETRGQLDHFNLFVDRYIHQAGTWRTLGKRFGLKEKDARGRAETVARHFRSVLRERLRHEVESEQAVDEEIAALRALL